MIEVQDRNRVEMSQRERDVLKVMQSVLDGQRTQTEAARLLKRSPRQIRRIQRKLEAGGDAVLVHGLRGKHYLKYRELAEGCRHGGSAPKPPEFIASAADASGKETGRGTKKASRPAGIQPTTGRSGRTPAEPYPADGEVGNTAGRRKVPAKNHPWRNGFKQLK
jgi:hypothetical protein